MAKKFVGKTIGIIKGINLSIDEKLIISVLGLLIIAIPMYFASEFVELPRNDARAYGAISSMYVAFATGCFAIWAYRKVSPTNIDGINKVKRVTIIAMLSEAFVMAVCNAIMSDALWVWFLFIALIVFSATASTFFCAYSDYLLASEREVHKDE